MGANTEQNAGSTYFSDFKAKAVEAYHYAKQSAATGLKTFAVVAAVAGAALLTGARIPGPHSAQMAVGGAAAGVVAVGAYAAGSALDETPAKPTRNDNLNQALAADDPARTGNQPDASNSNSSQRSSAEKGAVETTAAGDSFRFGNAP